MANQGKTVEISFNNQNGDNVVYVNPGDVVKFPVALGEIKVDVLGADIVLTNAEGAQVLLPSLALYLLSEDESVSFLYADGEALDPQDILSNIGYVESVSPEDFLAITSLKVTEESTEVKVQQGEEVEKSGEEVGGGESESDFESVATSAAPVVTDEEFEQLALGTEAKKDILEDLYDEKPVKIPKFTADDTKKESASSTDDAALDADAAATFRLDTALLQKGATIDASDPANTIIQGGGGSQEAVYDPDNTIQYQAEFIDASTELGPVTIYADDSNYFDDTILTREIELTPTLPDGFEITRITVGGLPAGFTFEGATVDGSNFVFDEDNIVFEADGTIRLALIYPSASTDTFTLNMEVRSSFDVESDTATSTPVVGTMLYEIEQQVEVKNVNSPSDANYVDGDGNVVWVLAKEANDNVIVAGDGGATIYGGEQRDNITSGYGDDYAEGGAGDDSFNMGGGDDTVVGGLGNDRIDGGLGTGDIVEYSDLSDDITVDFSNKDGDGFADATIGVSGEIDKIKNIEIINFGTGDDVVTGDALSSTYNMNDGDDIVYGSSGNDILDGGDGTDTLDYQTLSQAITLQLSANTVSAADGSFTDTYTNFEVYYTTGYDDTINDSDAASEVYGGAGADRFVMSNTDTYADIFYGGAGEDILDYTNVTNSVTVNLLSNSSSGTGADQVYDFTTVYGSQTGDDITGDTLANTLMGYLGDDTIVGGDGADTIYGGLGSDTLTGGNDASVDVLRFDDLSMAVTLNLGAGTATYVANSDVDTFSEFEEFYATNLDDTIIGSTAADRVFGLDGDDVFETAALDTADDYFDGGNNSTVGDTVDYSSASNTINADLTTGTVTGNGTDTLVNIENIIGSTGGDVILGNDSANRLDGGSGNDEIHGGIGNDTVLGGAGDDDLYGDDGDDYIEGQSGNDTISGGAGNDYLEGDNGDDTISGGIGDDEIHGNADNDILTGGSGDDIIYGGSGNDTIDGGSGDDTLDGGTGTDTLSYASSDAGIATNLTSSTVYTTVNVGNITNDQDSVRGFENIIGSSHVDNITANYAIEVHGGASDDIINSGNGNDTVYGDTGDDQIDTGSGDDTAYGGSGNDTIMGGSGIDTLYGESGDDNIYDGSGDDTVYGGAGDDTFYLGTGQNTIYGDGDFDTVNLSDITTYGATVDGVNDQITINGETSQYYDIEEIIGTDQADTFTESTGVDRFIGGAGQDRFNAAAGDSADDTFIGGDDWDLIDYSNASNAITVNLASNTITGNGVDAVSSIEAITGTSLDDDFTGNNSRNLFRGEDGNDTLRGEGGNDDLYGGDGADTIYGGAGSDLIYGGNDGATDIANFSDLSTSVTLDLRNSSAITATSGSDVDHIFEIEEYVLSNQDDIVYDGLAAEIIESGAGDDRFYMSNTDTSVDAYDGGDDSDSLDYTYVTSSVTVSLAAQSSTYNGTTDTVVNFENVLGSSQADTITGDGGNNTLNGNGGNDTIRGREGNDTIYGGSGNDIIYGGEGSDTLYGGSGTADELHFDDLAEAINLNLNTGQATGQNTFDVDTFDSSFEIYYATNQNDVITESTSADVVYGESGDDEFILLNADNNNDTFDAGLNGLVGDTLNAGAVTSNLTVNLATETLSGNGNDTIIGFENVTTGSGSDTVTGTTGDNVINTGSGSDRVYGQAGDDVIDTGAGNDEVHAGSGDDQINTGDGNDTLYLNSGDNIAYAGAGNDVIYAGTGNDEIYGEGGTNTLRYDNVSAAVTVNADAGTASLGASNDTFQDITNFYLTNLAGGDAYYESLSSYENVYAQGGDDTFYLRGDSITDNFRAGNGEDTLDFTTALGSSVTVDLAAQTAQINGFVTDNVYDFEHVIGTSGDDSFSGNNQDNTFDGGAGDDTFYSSQGADTYNGDSGDDTVDYSADTSAVTVDLENNTATDGWGDTDTLTSIRTVRGSNYGDTLTGDTLDNEIYGQGGADRIYGTIGDDTLDGGTGAFVDIVDYSNFTTEGVTLNVAAGTVTGGVTSFTDTISNFEQYRLTNQDDVIEDGSGADIIYGLDGDDTFTALDDNANDTFDGGDGTEDSISYAGFTNGVNINLSSGQVTRNGSVTWTDSVTDIEHVTATAQDDIIRGDAEDNTIDAGAGDDYVYASTGHDTIDGGAHTTGDTLNLSAFSTGVDLSLSGTASRGINQTDFSNFEIFYTTSSADLIIDSTSADIVYAGDGNDIFEIHSTGSDVDTYYGGQGADDVIDFSNIATFGVTVDLAGNSATVNGTTDAIFEIENIIGTSQADTITGDSQNNDIDAGGGNDTIAASAGNDNIDGGSGTDTIDFSAQVSAITVDISSITGAASGATIGSDTLTSIERVIGTASDDTITLGRSGITNGRVDAGDGNDTITVQDGSNDVYAESGNDTIYIEALTGTQNIYADAGTDLLSLENVTLSGATLDTANREITYTSQTGVINYDANLEQISLTREDDIVIDSAGSSYVLLNDGDDTVQVDISDVAADYYDGGDGNDTIDLSNESADLNFDLSSTSVGADTFVNFESIQSGSGNDTLTGDANDNEIYGNDGDDTISGGAGDDYLDGGAGNNTLTYENDTGAITLYYNTNIATDGYGNTDAVYNFSTITGSNFNDLILADNSGMTLYGGDGADNLRGGSGDDIIYGGDGDDGRYSNGHAYSRLTGGGGNDQVYGEAGDDYIQGSSGNDQLDGGTGYDRLYYYSGTLTVTINNADADGMDGTVTGYGTDTFVDFELIQLHDNDDTLYDNAGAVNVRMDDGNDTVIVGAGDTSDDTYNGGGSAAYRDTLDYSNISADMAVNMNSTTNNATGAGTDSVSNFENFIFGNGNDTFVGAGVDYDLTMGGGNDTVTTGSGDVTVDFGAGSDTYNYSSGDDVLDGGTGHDILNYASYGSNLNVDFSSTSGGYVLISTGVNVDRATDFEEIRTGSGDDTVTNDAAWGALTFDGGSGNDTFYVGTTNDTFIGGSGNDIADFSNLNTGFNLTLNASSTGNADFGSGNIVSLTSVETIIGSSAGDTITGGSSGHSLYGGTGDDAITGGSGSDTIYGEGGSDTLDGGGGIDTVSFASSANPITAFLDDGDGIGFATGNGNDTLVNFENIVGSSGSDVLGGDSGNNTINGGSGGFDTASYLYASGGIAADLGTNTVTGDGTDTLVSIEALVGSSNTDNFTLDTTSLGNYANVDGGAGDDTVTFNAGQLNYDSADLAGVFDNIEEIDLSNATLGSGDSFDMNIDDLVDMTDGDNELTLTMTNAMTSDLAIDSSSYTWSNTTTSGSTTTFEYSNDGGSTIAARLIVEAV